MSEESRSEFIRRAWKQARKMWYPTVSKTESIGNISAIALGEPLDFRSEYFLDDDGRRSVRIVCEGIECERALVPASP